MSSKRTMEEWFDHFRKSEPTASSRLLAACKELAEMQVYVEDILTKDRLKTREINILTAENRELRKGRSTCKHPPEARDITFCRICMQVVESREQS